MSKTAFIFPGQGAQYCGMGKDFFDQFAAARELGIRFYASRGSMDLSKKDGGQVKPQDWTWQVCVLRKTKN